MEFDSNTNDILIWVYGARELWLQMQRYNIILAKIFLNWSQMKGLHHQRHLKKDMRIRGFTVRHSPTLF